MTGHTRTWVKLLAGLLLCAGLAAATIGAWRWFVHSDLARTADIAIVGADRTDPAAILDASGLAIGDPVLAADLDAAATGVYRLPTIADVAVRHDSLLTLTIEVREHDPAFVIDVPGTGDPVVVTDYGVVLEPVTAAELSDLPTVRTSGELPDAGTRLTAGPQHDILDVAAQLPDSMRGQVADITSVDGSVQLTLRSGATVNVGTATDVPAKFDGLDDVNDRFGPLQAGTTVNLIAPSAPAVRPAS